MGKTLAAYRATLQKGLDLGLSPAKDAYTWNLRCDNARLKVYQAVYGRHRANTVYDHIMQIAGILGRVEAEVVAEVNA
jgi:hypothetical protein